MCVERGYNGFGLITIEAKLIFDVFSDEPGNNFQANSWMSNTCQF